MFCGFPIGDTAEPRLAAMATTVTALGRSIFVIFEIDKTSGTKINMAVSFMMTADDRDVMTISMKNSLNSDDEVFTIFCAILMNTPDNSNPREMMKKEIIADKLS